MSSSWPCTCIRTTAGNSWLGKPLATSGLRVINQQQRLLTSDSTLPKTPAHLSSRDPLRSGKTVHGQEHRESEGDHLKTADKSSPRPPRHAPSPRRKFSSRFQ